MNSKEIVTLLEQVGEKLRPHAEVYANELLRWWLISSILGILTAVGLAWVAWKFAAYCRRQDQGNGGWEIGMVLAYIALGVQIIPLVVNFFNLVYTLTSPHVILYEAIRGVSR